MGIAAHTNAWGQFWKNRSLPTSSSYGWTTFGNHAGQFSAREGHTSNPIITLGDGITWRNPSAYFREILNYYPKPGVITGYGETRSGFPQGTLNEVDYLRTYPLIRVRGMDTLVNERNRANTECLLKLKEERFNAGQFAAEANETARMLASSASDLFRAIISIKRGKLPRRLPNGTVMGVTKTSGGLWLQYQYGWKPLMMDLHDLYKEFQPQVEKAVHTVRATRSISSNWDRSSSDSYWSASNQQVRCDNRTMLYARVRHDTVRTAASMGLINPVSLAWELIPLSFVVDWAMPIGNLLEAFDATAGLDFIGGYTSQLATGSVTGTRRLSAGWSGTAVSVQGEIFTYRRSPLGGFPAPAPYVKSPFSTTHTASALALGRQALR